MLGVVRCLSGLQSGRLMSDALQQVRLKLMSLELAKTLWIITSVIYNYARGKIYGKLKAGRRLKNPK